MANIDALLKIARKLLASDVHLSVGSPPILRCAGRLQRQDSKPLTEEDTRQFARELLPAGRLQQVMAGDDLDFTYKAEGIGRFRTHVMNQRQGVDIVMRCIPDQVPSLQDLGLPPIVAKLLNHHQGIILVTGPKGAGKTTTLAAMVDFINSTRRHHILTIEEPIEFLHPYKQCVVNQREVGRHTRSWQDALRASLREDPDVIVVGELRDLETIALALTASETGHLVLSTMLTANAQLTVERIVDSFPSREQPRIRAVLGDVLRAVISQQLVPTRGEEGLALAAEVLLGTLPLATLIRERRTFQIPSLIQTGKNLGMQRMDDSLAGLVAQGRVRGSVAALQATEPRALLANMGGAP